MQPLVIFSRSSLLLVALTSGIFALASCATVAPDPVAEVAKPEVVARGKSLVQGLAACGFCHGAAIDSGAATAAAPLIGGRVLHDIYGAVVAPNITQKDGALGEWSAAQIRQLLRSGIRPDGSLSSPEVHRGYEWMSDQDLNSVITYLRTRRAEGEIQPRREVSFVDRNTKGFWESSRDVRGYVPQLNRGFTVEYGKYLADNVGRCASCHNQPSGAMTATQYMAGGKTVQIGDESKIAPGLTNSSDVGLGSWSEEEIVGYLRTGQTPAGRAVDERFCPVGFYRLADQDDLVAIAKFLKTVQ